MEQCNDLLVSLRRVIRAIDLYSKKLSKETGLTSPQLLVLHQIEATDGVLAKHVADAINLSSATVTSILDRLESREFVTRERSTEDKRKVKLHLTQKGREALVESPQPLQAHFIRRFEHLEQWEQTMIIASMQRVANMMDAEDLDASPLLQVGSIHAGQKTELAS